MLMNRLRKSKGFTLLELALAVSAIALVAAFTVPTLTEDITQRNSEVAAGEILAIAEAARAFAVLNQGQWPGLADGCDSDSAFDALQNVGGPPDGPVFLAGFERISSFGEEYQTSCTPTLFTISLTSTQDAAAIISNSLPLTELAPDANFSNTTTNTFVTLPGSVSSFDAKLSRIDEGRPELNQMETNLSFINGAGIRSSENDAFSLTLLDETGNANSEAERREGSLEVNDIALRALNPVNPPFLSDVISNFIVYVGSIRMVACERPGGRDLIDAFDNCNNRIVNVGNFTNGDRPSTAVIRAEICAHDNSDVVESLEGRGGVNTIAEVRESDNVRFRGGHSIFVDMLPGDQTGRAFVEANAMFGGRAGGGSHNTVFCQATQHFVPLDDQQRMLLRVEYGRFIDQGTVEIFLEGYIR